jgi:RimJ/RimL family protein N-acetyltransferase
MDKTVSLLAGWGFADRDAAVIVWRSAKGDWTWRKTAWRLGFTFEGTVRAAIPDDGRLRDGWVATLLAADDRVPKGRWLEVPVLEGAGLRLRPWRVSDVPQIVEACSDPRTQTWLGQMPAPYEESDALTWLEHQQEHRACGTSVAWAVADLGDDVASGSVSYFGLVPEVEAEIGYWAHPQARGRGLMSRAMGLVVHHLFEDVGVRRVCAGAAVDNAASRHVIEANGLRQWGVERLGTAVRTGRADLAWYDVLVEEWRESRRRGT